jgi:hypothetical protein
MEGFSCPKVPTVLRYLLDMNYTRVATTVAPFMAIVLLGAGCNPFSPATNEPTAVTPVATSTTPTTPVATSTTTIDDTWDSYSSKSGFTFSYPTKGRLTPEWSIDNHATNDAKILNGCFVDGSSERANGRTTLTVGGTTFCVTRNADPGAGQIYYSDHYAFENGRTITVITFTKHFTNGSNYDREECHGKTVVPVGTNDCATFEEADYINVLDTAIKTFTKE